MREIQLTQSQVALVDDEDFERLNQFKWYASRQGTQKKFYAVRGEYKTMPDGKRKYTKRWLHREVVNCPPDMVVDHLSGDGLDCRKNNLEIVSFTENCRRVIEKQRANIAARVFAEANSIFGTEITA